MMHPHTAMIVKLADRNAVLPGWAADRIGPNKFNRDQKELPRYAEIEARFKGEAQNLVARFLAGDLGKEGLAREFRKALYRAETEAFVAGKRSSGKPVVYVTPGEQRMLTGRHSRNMRYFMRFVRDMEAGRGRMDYVRRAGLYASSLWSLYNRGQSKVDWDAETSPNARYEWVMDADAEHCPDCVERWRGSRERGGYTWDELIQIGFPGEGTQCMVNCRCHIQPVIKKTVESGRVEEAVAQEQPQAGVKLLQSILGGENMPLRVPAAGLPSVKVEPAVVARSINNAGDSAAELARRIPEAIKTMVSPERVYDSEGRKTYVGNGLMVEVIRSPENGSWALNGVYVLSESGIPQGVGYVAPWLA